MISKPDGNELELCLTAQSPCRQQSILLSCSLSLIGALLGIPVGEVSLRFRARTALHVSQDSIDCYILKEVLEPLGRNHHPLSSSGEAAHVSS